MPSEFSSRSESDKVIAERVIINGGRQATPSELRGIWGWLCTTCKRGLPVRPTPTGKPHANCPSQVAAPSLLLRADVRSVRLLNGQALGGVYDDVVERT